MFKAIKIFLACLTSAERRRLLVFAAVAALTATLELSSLLAIYPLVLLGIHEAPTQGPIVSIPHWFGFEDTQNIGLFWAYIMLGTVLLSFAARALTTWIQFTFAESLRHTLSTRVFRTYLCRPYAFLLRKNTSELTSAILSEVDLIVTQTAVGLFQAVAALSVLVATAGMLIIAAPTATLLVILVAAGFYCGIYLIMSKLVAKNDVARFGANRRRHLVINESFALLREIKIRGLENVQVAAYSPHAKVMSKALARHSLISHLPRIMIETLLFGSAALFMLVFYVKSDDLSVDFADLLPTVSLMIASTVRMLPAAQTVYRVLNGVRGSLVGLSVLHEALQHEPQQAARPLLQPLTLKQSIVFDAVTFIHEGSVRPSVQNCSFVVRKGEIIGIKGATGSGKSTVVDLVMGLLEPTSGHITIDGATLTQDRRVHWQRNVGFVAQDVVLSDDTVLRNIAFGVPDELIDLDRAREVARIACISEMIEQLPQGYDASVGQGGVALSGGQRQRLSIARALYHDPEVIIFDEATSALDIETERRVLDQIRTTAKSKTMIMVAHRLDTLKSCDMIITIKDGTIMPQNTR